MEQQIEGFNTFSTFISLREPSKASTAGCLTALRVVARRAVNARQTAGLTGWTWGNGIRGGQKRNAPAPPTARASRLLNNGIWPTMSHVQYRR